MATDEFAVGAADPQAAATPDGFDRRANGHFSATSVRETKERSRARRRQFVPTERDRQIVRWVGETGVATREQVQRLLFSEGGRSRCQERLTLLVQHLYLDRLEGRRANGPDVYMLSRRCVNGHRLLRAEGLDIRNQRIPEAKLQHALDIADCRVQFVRGAAASDASVVRWLNEDELSALTVRHGVLPDAYLQLLRTTPAGERRSSFFLEVERSGKAERLWREKFRRYGEFYYGGTFEQLFGSRALRVLVLVAGEFGARPGRIIERLADMAGELRVTFLRFAPLQDFVALGADAALTAPIWRRPGSAEVQGLLSAEAVHVPAS